MKLKQLIPTNIQEEKEKFFADFSYNPQFTYDHPIDTVFLQKYSYLIENPELLTLAKKILSEALQFRNHQDLKMLNGKLLTRTDVTAQIEGFLKLHNLQDAYSIVWTEGTLVRTSIDANTITLNRSAEFRKYDLHSMLYHEIGTHALRRKNYEKQPWFKRKKKYGFQEYLLTEEGIATIHGLLPLKVQLAHRIALNFITCTFANEHSFSETFKQLEQYQPDPDERWKRIIRIKRGVEDTSHPGGFLKDSIYLAGFVEIIRWLDEHDYNLTPLYFGKLAHQDIDKALQLNPNFEPQLPSFYLINQKEYASRVREIGELNFILS